jgi:NADPH-dependent glutamate synthase beta subunit-like oxidoreductase/CO/xanthine dehydrogenase FAD-binding subunit
MKPFTHVDAKTVKQAVTLLTKNQGKAKLIAGGTDLLSTLKDKILPDYPETLINIKTIPTLNDITAEGSELTIGALAKLEALAHAPVVQKNYTILAQAAEAVATPQIRRMGTIGGNLCQDVRCWYYRYPHSVGGRILCYLKGGKSCYALTRENEYHSIFGGWRDTSTPCSSACPAGVDIPSYVSTIREGNLSHAAKTLLKANPLPSITGRVCPHFCEQQCNRGEFDESVSIRDIERFMGDYILDNAADLMEAPKAESGKSVAIIGSGPAGLAAAYYLRISGHRVTVFDKREEPGGMLTYVIPTYRLPKDIVKRAIEAIKTIGVEFKCNVDIGKDITLDTLTKDFDSVFIATGAWNPVSIGLKGEEATRFCLDFLININRGITEIPGKKVLVIGGGNAAVDVAVSALRLGAEQATMACLECEEEMPALPWEIELAVEQGVKVMPSWGPHRVLTSKGKVTGMELISCTSVFDEQGCFAPCFDDALKETVEADQILMAVGYDTDLTFIDPKTPVKRKQGLLPVDPMTQATNLPGIFAGGSVTHGPATVIEAIASGRKAAAAMDTYLKGKAQAEDKDKKTAEPFLTFNSDYLKKTPRVQMPKRPVAERSIAVEDTLGLDLGDIAQEANRCFNCGCVSVGPSDMGVVLLALGAQVEIAGPKGTRIVPIEDFFGSLRTTLTADEMVTQIQVPQPPKGARQTFLKFRLRESVDYPIVSVASVITVKDGICQDARIVLGAVAPAPVRATMAEEALKGTAINAKTAQAASQAALEDAIPLEKNSYKVTIARELVRRAILAPESSGEMR